MLHTVPSVLIVDDTPSARKILGALLKTEGYRLAFAASGIEALETAAVLKPDLILMDVMMPDMDGYEVCRRLRATPDISEIPIIMVTALEDRASRLKGLEAGADDFLTKPIDWSELRARTRTVIRLNRYRRISVERQRYELLIQLSPDGIVMVDAAGKIVLTNKAAEALLIPVARHELRGVLLHELLIEAESVRFSEIFVRVISGRSPVEHLETRLRRGADTPPVAVEISLGRHEWNDLPAVQCLIRDITVRKAVEREQNRLFREVTRAYDATIETLAFALELRDHMGGHSKRVADMSVRIAEAMGIRGDDLTHIRRGAFLHDIGKIAIPDSILCKPGPLSAEEWTIMRSHPDIASDLLSRISFLRQSTAIPYFHHEKWDGSGYGQGLSGENIPIFARIFSVVDVWDSLSSDRVYERAWLREKVVEYCRAHAGSHFDPEVVAIFLEILKQQSRSAA